MNGNESGIYRPFARQVAQVLTDEEIDLVAGGTQNTGGCYRTLTGVQQSRDGEFTYTDTDTCPSGTSFVQAQEIGG